MEFDVQYDIVVVGGGGSGKSAAYTVAKESDLKVALLEKMEETGGSSVYAEGTGASESSEQKARGDKCDYPGKDAPAGSHYPTCEEHVKRYVDYSHFRANPEVAKSFVYNSAETIDIFKELGIEYTDVTIYAYDQPLELFTFHRPDGLGAKCQEVLHRACVNEGVDIFTSTAGKELLLENGKVVGIKAIDGDGEELLVGASAVILATGGMGNNMEMVAKYSWIPDIAENNVTSVPTENTGDGITMAMNAGAGTRNLGTLMILSVVPGKTLGCQLHAAGQQPSLWLDSTGKRFASEDVALSFADNGNTNALAKGGRMFNIMDDEYIKALAVEGSKIGLGDFVVFRKPIDGFEAEAEESIKANEGVVFKADTIEELAEQMGLPVETVVGEVTRYNKMCAQGKDTDLYKDPQYLQPIAKAPFWAVKKAPSILVSDGGIFVNGKFEVCRDDASPIKGLYAVGNEASGLYGDTYNLDCPGTANGFAHTSGRVAARNAIAEITA